MCQRSRLRRRGRAGIWARVSAVWRVLARMGSSWMGGFLLSSPTDLFAQRSEGS